MYWYMVEPKVFFLCLMLFVDSLFVIYKICFPLNSLILCMQEISEVKIVSLMGGSLIPGFLNSLSQLNDPRIL